ncbi:MAG: hypothetical protein IAF38_12640, partial [Bacteroidia bacterium]|nr:hypothetical protein [Bacteroidia bacterium]
MKTPSDELFRLIKSLGAQEKRFFKLSVSDNKEKNNYTLLFDSIDKQDAYNENELRKKIKHKGLLDN